MSETRIIDHGNAGLFESLYIHEAEVERYERNGKPEGQRLNPLHEGFCFELGGRELTVLHCPVRPSGILRGDRSMITASEPAAYCISEPEEELCDD